MATTLLPEHLDKASVHDLKSLVTSLSHERDVLADDVLVKSQMVITIANRVQIVKEQYLQAKGILATKNETIQRLEKDVASLRQQVTAANGRIIAAEQKAAAAEDELSHTRDTLEELHAKMESVGALEDEVAALKRERVERASELDVWKANVKEALKEGRRKEADASQKAIEQSIKITQLQEQLDKAHFDIEAARVRERHRPTISTEVQTDEVEFGSPTDPATSANLARHRPGTPDPTDTLLTITPDHVLQNDATPFKSPPPVKPPSHDLPPIIVSVHYGSPEGWTVTTKLAVNSGTSVKDLTANACERINDRNGAALDCAAMCLKINHPRAKRFVVLSDHREVHSFSYIVKSSQDGNPIVLNLEPLPPNATYWNSPMQPSSRSAARGASAGGNFQPPPAAQSRDRGVSLRPPVAPTHERRRSRDYNDK